MYIDNLWMHRSRNFSIMKFRLGILGSELDSEFPNDKQNRRCPATVCQYCEIPLLSLSQIDAHRIIWSRRVTRLENVYEIFFTEVDLQ